MKKISLFTLAIATGLAVFAQGDPQLKTPMAKKVMFGIEGGVNLATFDVKSDEFANPSLAPNTNMKTSFHGGFFVDIPLAGNLHVVPAAIYSAQGSKYASKTQSGTGTTSTNYEEDLHYINVPVKLKLATASGFFVETGPQLGYLIRANLENTSNDTEVDIKDQRKKLDFSWGAGLGYLTRVGLGIHARYNYGFSNVLNAEDDNMQGGGKMQNRVVQIGLAYHFGANK